MFRDHSHYVDQLCDDMAADVQFDFLMLKADLHQKFRNAMHVAQGMGVCGFRTLKGNEETLRFGPL